MPVEKLTSKTDEYSWGRMVWLIEAANAENPDMSLARMEVEAGQTSEPHVHGNCHECIHVISGEIIEHIGDEALSLVAGETVFIPQGTSHFTQNPGDKRAVLIITYSAQTREYEAIS